MSELTWRQMLIYYRAAAGRRAQDVMLGLIPTVTAQE